EQALALPRVHVQARRDTVREAQRILRRFGDLLLRTRQRHGGALVARECVADLGQQLGCNAGSWLVLQEAHVANQITPRCQTCLAQKAEPRLADAQQGHASVWKSIESNDARRAPDALWHSRRADLQAASDE